MSTELLIYDAIDPYYGVSASGVLRALCNASGEITVRINSPGGSALDGVAIYTALNRYDGRVIVEIEGLAASAASIIAMAGDEIRVAQGAMMMVHECWAYTQGPAEDHESTAAMLRKLNAEVATIYAARTGKSESEILSLMAYEAWMGASEAVSLGFADSAISAKARPTPDTQASARMFAAFRRPPQAMRPEHRQPVVATANQAAHKAQRAPILTPLANLSRRA